MSTPSQSVLPPSPAASSPMSVDTAAELARSAPGITNTEPGFANTYGPGTSSPGGLLAASLPALGVGGLGALLLYHRYLQDKRNAQRAEKEKQASGNSVLAQLPGVHPKDMLLGAALGGGAGILYDTLAAKPENEKRLPKALKRILGGAAIGAAGANVVGDRARRYITNTQLPFGYGTSGSVLPKSFKQFWEGAVLDKPSFDPAAVQEIVNSRPYNKQYGAIVQNMLGARRELLRRTFGVHGNNPDTDFWQKNKGTGGPDYYSLNEARKDYPQLVKDLFLPTRLSKPPQSLFAAPGKAVAQENTAAGWINTELFGADSLLGGQQVSLQPAGKKFKGRVLDRYDVTPTKQDIAELKNAVLSGKILDPKWRAAKRTDSGYYAGHTNSSYIKSLLARLLVDNVLAEEHPWVSQSFTMQPSRTPRRGADWNPLFGLDPTKPHPAYSLQMTQESGKPAVPAMNYSELLDYLARLHTSAQR